MPLSGTRLEGTLDVSLLATLAAAFPVPSGLLPAEKTAYTASQTALATALSTAIGPDVVTEITGNALVPGVSSGSSTTVVT